MQSPALSRRANSEIFNFFYICIYDKINRTFGTHKPLKITAFYIKRLFGNPITIQAFAFCPYPA
ncbi:hypothetical protein DDR33_03315 [Pararcticibacter amylolyticus]|uniref:Uncharacterized protein n=1 Tax=Pararcticibacter amylolyticus TaxID=2173175 RepID=A0A2U2PKX9_9SPHI|nr:hypothetical protein DDR33_03315 [Pararcticibacter amylolyticus]